MTSTPNKTKQSLINPTKNPINPNKTPSKNPVKPHIKQTILSLFKGLQGDSKNRPRGLKNPGPPPSVWLRRSRLIDILEDGHGATISDFKENSVPDVWAFRKRFLNFYFRG